MDVDIKSRIKSLGEEILRHNKAYYTEDNPSILDSEYDKLKRELSDLEEQYPQYASGVLEKVGYKSLDVFKKVLHKIPMLSLSNGFSIEDVRDFITRCKNFLGNDSDFEIYCEPKIDGLDLSSS